MEDYLREQKIILTKAIQLDKALTEYNSKDLKANRKKVIVSYCEGVWGVQMANHLLSEYTTAEQMIWSFDRNNLKLFLEKY